MQRIEVRRQAARFYIYKFEAGKEPEEIKPDTPGVTELTWTVHIANKKATWYTFQRLKGEHGYASNHELRNPDKTNEAERKALMIDAGPRSISGKGTNGPDYQFRRDNIPVEYNGSFPPG